MTSPVFKSPIPLNYLDTDTALTANSDVKVATQKAVKAYIASQVSTPPTKNTGAEIDTGTDDAKYATAKSIADSKLSYTDGTETLTNKTLTSPVINTPTGDVVTPTGTQTLTNKTLTSPVIGAITNTDHISMTPGTSKLVKIAVLEQGNTTNTYRNNAIILTGWGFLNGNGASTSYKAKDVTFGITFSTLPVVLANAAGRSATGSGATDGLASTWQDWLVGTATAVAVGGFSMNVFQTNNVNLANYDYLYAWIAIGTLT